MKNLRKTYKTMSILLTILISFSFLSCKDDPSNPIVNQSNAAEIVFQNGIIYTVNSNQTIAEAVAVKDQKIVFIGSDNDVNQYVGESTVVINLKGKMLLPGFIDNHVHAGEGGEVTCFPDDDYAIDEQINLLAQCSKDVANGEWIIGYGMHLETVLGYEEPFKNPLELLDDIFPDNPVIIMEQTSHAMFANTLAINEAGISSTTSDPQGGKFMKDNAGNLNGVLVDNAGDLVMEIAVNATNNKFNILYDGILFGMEELRKNGITTIGDGRTYWKRGMIEAWKSVESNGLLTSRVSVRPWIYPTVTKSEQIEYLKGVFQNDISQSLIINQVKMYIDGVPENGTAKVIEPYTYTLFPELPNGLNYIPQEDMKLWLTDLYALGYGAHIHALGDGGVREVLNAVEHARNQGSELKYHMTHISMMDPADLNRFASLKVDADIQTGSIPQPTLADKMEGFIPFIGQARASQLHYRPLKELNESGANVVLSSDWTVNPLSPLNGISVSVDEGSLDIATAIKAYTINPATALGLETITGTIEVGKSADFVILNDDLTKLSPKQIKNTKVIMTVFQGEIVYE